MTFESLIDSFEAHENEHIGDLAIQVISMFYAITEGIDIDDDNCEDYRFEI